MTEPNLAGPAHRTSLLFAAAAVVAGIGAGVLFDAEPGANWSVWVAVAALGLLLMIPNAGQRRGPPAVLGIIAIVIAGAASVSANPVIHFVIFLAVALALAMQMLLVAEPALRRVSAIFTVSAPVLAISTALVQAARRLGQALELVKSPRARGVLRGALITLPVVVIFALLLAGADPTFASWRDAVADFIEEWDFLPRTIFFLVLFVIVLGAYGSAALASSSVTNAGARRPTSWRLLGSTERIILLAGVSGLFWLFAAVQLSYLFGNLPSVPGSGVTFAEYARRGFAELTVVATASAFLILASERFGREDGRERLIRGLTLALLVAVLFLLGSAFRRVWLYEEAYGFTIARLYAQAYMIVVALSLGALALELRDVVESGRLFRRVAGIATVTFLVVAYWNHEAWIASRNVARFATTGKLDIAYLARELSPDAVPAVIRESARLPEPYRSALVSTLAARYRESGHQLDDRWFEWNLGRARARSALRGL